MKENATVTTSCECGQLVVIDNCWEPGGINDYGGYVLKCHKCGKLFDFYLGRDVMDSHVESGADMVDRYFKDQKGHREEVLTKHGLPVN